MRIVVASCAVEYAGRLNTTLPVGVRAIIMKADGSVAVHAESSAIKPLNWMVSSSEIDMPDYRSTPEPTVWQFATKKERLVITLHEVHSDTQFLLDVNEPGLNKVGTELQLQEWLSKNPHTLGRGISCVTREFPTGSGPVDLLCVDPDGTPVAVEVKRTASIGAVDQLSRYVEAINESGQFTLPARGMIAAFDVRPRARTLAERRGFTWTEIDMSTLTGVSGDSAK